MEDDMTGRQWSNTAGSRRCSREAMGRPLATPSGVDEKHFEVWPWGSNVPKAMKRWSEHLKKSWRSNPTEMTETSARHHSSNTTRPSVVRTSPSPDRSKNQRITVARPTEHCCSLPLNYGILRGEDVQVWCHLRTLDPGRVHLWCRKPRKGVRGMRTCSVNREG